MMSHSYNDKRKCNLNSRLKFKKFSLKIWALTMLMLFGLQSITVRSQQYPVKLVPVVIPPYSMRLGDYATSTDNKLQLQVLMTDLMEPQHQTGIKFTLEAGLNAAAFAQSNEFVVGMNPFLLYPGSNVTLTNVDLRALFELQNLGGINAVQYSQPLSDGVYQFCFQAYDYYTKNNLSSKTCATVFLIQYDPPMLNLPQNAEKIQAVSPYAGGSGIVFQWMPRQIAPNTKYIFTLKELWDSGQSPISGFLSSPALWTEETYAPTLYYGLDKTQLIPGKRYAWQVQAKSGNPVLGANPIEDNGVYKNNGLSEIYYFDYVENCTVPTLLMAKNVGRGRVEISWSLAGNASGLYSVQYRKKGSTSEWVSEQSYQPKYIITGLEDQTEYEYRIGSVCGQVQSSNDNAYSYSGIQYFTTDANDTSNNYQCGIMPAVDITNKNPLQTLLGANEVFMAGDFPVTVISAQGSNGIYSGTGYIVVPYLADTKIKVIFNNIKINTDKKLVEGIIETTYDPNETAVNYASGAIGETFGDAGVKDVFVNFPIGGITYSATPPPGKITITGSDGNGGTGSTTEYPGGKDYTFTDPDGNIWTVDENGTVTQGGTVAQGGASTSTNTDGVTGSGNNATVNQYTAKGIKIEWKENTSGQFAYDTAEKTKLPKDKYPSVKDSENNTVYVPYKATVNKKTELFNAKVSITDPALKEAKIVFKTLSIGKAIEATEINKTDTERNYQLKLPGTFDYAEEEVIAVLMPKDSTSKQKVISSFRLVHLSPKTVNVSLVPLDANSQSKLQSQGDKLNQVYNKIGITFNVTKDPVLDINSVVSGDTINSEDADLMSTYSPQQQQINALYKGTDARYVLFVTDKKSSTGQKGYMRLNGQFGYVYNNAQDKTGAHELGHGVFKLEHPWKAYGTTQSVTPLLMDYSTGEELSHLDWKQINDPAFKLYAFQGQSSGEHVGGIFYLADWTPIKFNYNSQCIPFDTTPNGTISGIINGKGINGKDKCYSASFENGQWKYKTGNEYLNDDATFKQNLAAAINLKNTDKVYLSKKIFNGCDEIYSSTHSYVTQNKDKSTLFDTPKFEYQAGDCSQSAANAQGVELIKNCGKDAFYEPHYYAVQAADGTTTWGEKVVKYLDYDIDNNKVNKFGDNLEALKLGDLKYINPGKDYMYNDVFKALNIVELNDKLGYLEASTGIQTYFRFVDVACTFTQAEGDKFAKDIFENSKISKTKGVYVLIVKNSSSNGQYQWRTYFAFGSQVSQQIQTSANNLLTINNVDKFSSFGSSIINWYKNIPKKQVQYIYIIEKATDAEYNAALQGQYKLTKNISGKVSTVENAKGNAIQPYFILKDASGTLSQPLVLDTEHDLKEQYVAESALDLAKRVAGEKAKWKFTYVTYGPKGETINNDDTPSILKCHFSFNQTCAQYYIDNAFLAAGIISIPFGGEVMLVVDGAAIIYYASTGQTDTALMYLAGYAIGPVIGSTIKGIAVVAPKIIRFTGKLYTESRLVLQLEQGLTKEGVETLLKKELNTGVKEWMVPNAEYGNYFVKATDDEILVGYIKTEQNIDKLVVLADKKGTHSLSNKLDNVAEQDLKKVINETIQASENYLALYPNVRSFLGNSMTKQYLNSTELYKFEEVIRKAHPDVLKNMNQMDSFDFAEMVRGYKDLLNNNKLSTFENAIKDLESFNGKYGWLSYWKLTPGIKYSLTIIQDLRNAGKLLPTGNSTDIQLASLQAFTRKGDFINIPMRYNKSYLGEYAEKGYNNVTECLNELRKVSGRKVINEKVLSGKTFSKTDFDKNFVNGIGKEVEYTSFISTSKKQSVAEGFIELTKKWAGDGEKVAIIQRIESKDGVYIDDLSDWGINLGPIRHSGEKVSIQIQEEVLLTPSKLRQTAEPIPIMENGQHKLIDGMKAYYVDFIQIK